MIWELSRLPGPPAFHDCFCWRDASIRPPSPQQDVHKHWCLSEYISDPSLIGQRSSNSDERTTLIHGIWGRFLALSSCTCRVVISSEQHQMVFPHAFSKDDLCSVSIKQNVLLSGWMLSWGQVGLIFIESFLSCRQLCSHLDCHLNGLPWTL